ncbi:MAG: LysM peptidoglycan-binding domain-containing protein, partial [Nitrosomonas sp.]|nr:LysM peptidoglycan-binding domain-containing protein [Nitrosomonas sp.]
MLPLAVNAAGLGKLKLNSALGQPLNAEIDIVSVNNDEISSLKVELASRDAFTQAGIRYEHFFSTIKFAIEPRTNGDPYVVITSPQSINEPFLNLLIELSWDSGRLLREYTVLLDPIDYSAPDPVLPSINFAPVAIETSPDIETIEQSPQIVDQERHVNRPVEVMAATVKKSESRDTYGPVRRGDTLSDIARQIMPGGVNLNQMLVALYRANRDSFINNNLNLLKVGAVLRIPDSSEIKEIDRAEANAEVKVQVADWRSYRERLVAISSESKASEEIKQSDSGQITTTVDNDTASHEAPTEVLRLSSAYQSADSQGEGADIALVDRLRMMEEDAIARNLALKEANERVSMLEKQIENLQKLMALKQPDLAKAQHQAEVISEVDPTSESVTDAIEIIDATPESITNSDFDTVFKEDTDELSDPFIDGNVEEPIVLPNPVLQETIEEPAINPIQLSDEDEAFYMDLVMKNIEYVAGALGLMLLVLLLVKRRQRKAEEDTDIDDMDFDDSPPTQNEATTVASASAAAGVTSSLNSDNISSEHEEAEDHFDNKRFATEGDDDDFEKDASFFSQQNDFDGHEDENDENLPEQTQGIEDDLDNELSLDNEIELDSDDSSLSQHENVDVDMADEAYEADEVEGGEVEADESVLGDDQAEFNEQIELDTVANTAEEDDGMQFDGGTVEVDADSTQSQSDNDHEIEFDLGVPGDDEVQSEQDENEQVESQPEQT